MKIGHILCLSLLAAAGSRAHAAAPNHSPVARPATTYPLVVSFISYGSGVPWSAIAQFNVVVNEFEMSYGSVQRVVAPWGREGEFDVCFPLTDLSPYLQQTLRDELLGLDGEPYTEVAENVSCGE